MTFWSSKMNSLAESACLKSSVVLISKFYQRLKADNGQDINECFRHSNLFPLLKQHIKSHTERDLSFSKIYFLILHTKNY